MYPFRSKEKDGGDHTHLRSMVTKTEPIHPPPLLGKLGVQGSDSRIAWEPVPHKTRQKSAPTSFAVRAAREEHRRSTPQALFGRGEDPHHPGWPAWRVQYCQAVPAGRYRRGALLPLVEGVPGSRQAAADTARAATSGEVTDLRREARALKEVVVEQALELRLLKKTYGPPRRQG